MGSGFIGSIRYAYSSGYYNNGVMVSASQPANNSQLSIRVPDYSNANTSTEPNTTVNMPITTSGAVDVLNRQWYGTTPTLNSTDMSQYIRGSFIDSGDYNNPLYSGLPETYK